MKNAIVTGGTKGIGLATVKMLLEEGYHVVATYAHDEASAAACGNSLSTIFQEYEIVKCDQADKSAVSSFTQNIKSRFSHIDALVCNAGTTLRKSLVEITDEDWERVVQVNVNSNMAIIRDLYDVLVAEGEGHCSVVLMGSMMGIEPHGTSLAYGVTKSATHALAKNLVKCFEGRRVTVNAVAPGFVETEWQREKPQEIRDNICRKTAVGRFATVEEVADVVRFCIKNGYVNGSVIEVSGGYSYK